MASLSRRRFIGTAMLGAGVATAPAALAAQTTPARKGRSLPANFPGFDSWIAAVLNEWKVPGVAVGAVRNGQVVLSKGYGYRNVAQQLPMTARTLLAIGSNSKSFTAMVLGTLVDEKKLEWDEPIRNYMSDFQVYDEVATRLMTARDLLNHRSGLPPHNAIFHGRSFTRQELYHRLRFLEPSTTFRQRYQYNNLMYMTAGVLAERITGQSWEELVRQRIFEPLGMTRSNLSVTDMQEANDYSLPYAEVDDEPVAIPFRNIDAIGPSGSINSNVEEMIRYVQMNIDGGTCQGRTIVSKVTAAQMHSPQSAEEQPGAEYPQLGPGSYGLGVHLNHYRGCKVVYHGGGIDGFFSCMSWLPDEKIGVVVLTNSAGNMNQKGLPPVFRLIAHDVLDRLLGLPSMDWVAQERQRQRETEARLSAARQEQAASRVPGTSPTHELSAYGGKYEHPGYGSIAVTVQDGRLMLTLDGLTNSLEHFHYDVFKTVPLPGGSWQAGIGGAHRVTFASDKNGKIDQLEVDLEPAISDIVFKRA